MKTGASHHHRQGPAPRNRPGGAWAALDPVARGRVQIVPAGGNPISQAQVVVAELERLSGLTPNWEWSACAVVARGLELPGPSAQPLRASGHPR